MMNYFEWFRASPFVSYFKILLLISTTLSIIKKGISPVEGRDVLLVRDYIDNRGHIRLNISWTLVLDQNMTSISIKSNESECSFDDRFDNIEGELYITVPPLEMKNPKESIKPGCRYLIKMETSDKELASSSLIVGCSTMINSYKIDFIRQITDSNFEVVWMTPREKIKNVKFFCRSNDDGRYLLVYPHEITSVPITINNHFLEIKDIHNGNYTFTTIFTDEHNCPYNATFNFSVASKTHIILPTIIILLVTAVLGAYLIRLRELINNRRRQAVQSTHRRSPRRTELINLKYVPFELQPNANNFDEYEIPRNNIVIKKEIGRGAFGAVYYAKAYNLCKTESYTMVAVKQLHDGANAEEEEQFKDEINILKKIGHHENIVRLLASCTINKPYMMIMELVPCGALKDYLIDVRNMWTRRYKNQRHFFPENMDVQWHVAQTTKRIVSDDIDVPWPEPQSPRFFSYDSSDGSYIIPEYKSSTNIEVVSKKSINPLYVPHNKPEENNPSPRSFMTVTSGQSYSIADTMITTLYPEPETPVIDSNILEPQLDHTELQEFAYQIACGMAHLEKMSITHRDLAARNILITDKKYLKISDFGMSRKGTYVNRRSKRLPLRWMAIEAITDLTFDSKSDVWSFGVVLWEIGTLGGFPYENIEDKFILYKLQEGYRLERPEICTDELYNLMCRCWSVEPENRPTFQEMEESLHINKMKVYVDFKHIDPSYIFPPAEVNQKETSSN